MDKPAEKIIDPYHDHLKKVIKELIDYYIDQGYSTTVASCYAFCDLSDYIDILTDEGRREV